jgi:hypothetical protein
MIGPPDPGPRDLDPHALPIAEPPQRVSGMRVPESWRLPGKLEGLTPAAEDAWRQTGFLLGDDLRLLEAGLALQAQLAAAGYTPTARTMRMAAFASLWSRAFSSTSDAATLVRRGAYQSALPLLRQAVEHVAAQSQLGSELNTFRRWAHEAYGRDADTRAEDIGLGHFFGGEAIAADAELRTIYRAASDFARPNFGPTALFVAAEASHARYPLVFADEAFHLGWAQLLLGWALRIDANQLHVALHLREHFPTADATRGEAVAHARAVDAHLAQPNRCRLEEHVDAAGRRRHLIVDFRRRPADAARRLLL